MIEYTNSLSDIEPEKLNGFFVGWPNPPSTQKHIEILQNSYCFWLAIDKNTNHAVGFINAVSDGVLSAYIPLLEVLPEYQGRGIGKELTNKMLNSLKNLYMIDLLCDENLIPFYNNLGMHKTQGVFLRNYENQNGEQG